MTIEQEAREIVERTKNRSRWDMENQTYVPETFPWLEKDIAKALKAKQDRIEELERKTKQCDACLKWNMPDSAHTCRKHDLVKKVEELESALKNLCSFFSGEVEKVTMRRLEEFTEAVERAKKAIGGGK